MRPSLEGKQASGEGESHTQDVNVAEVSYGKDGYCRILVSSLNIEPPDGERFGRSPV
jgi:hypothetical protein